MIKHMDMAVAMPGYCLPANSSTFACRLFRHLQQDLAGGMQSDLQAYLLNRLQIFATLQCPVPIHETKDEQPQTKNEQRNHKGQSEASHHPRPTVDSFFLFGSLTKGLLASLWRFLFQQVALEFGHESWFCSKCCPQLARRCMLCMLPNLVLPTSNWIRLPAHVWTFFDFTKTHHLPQRRLGLPAPF